MSCAGIDATGRWAVRDDGRRRQGTFLRIPYDFRRLTTARARCGMWDPDSPRILVPKAWGWGYGINLHALARTLRLIRTEPDPPRQGDRHRD
jgi:uncharacterized protein DUF5808